MPSGARAKSRARTGIELAAVADVGPSTASVHLHRLEGARLVSVRRQGKHHYYSLAGAEVARLLERLAALAGGSSGSFACRAPQHLRAARTCYDTSPAPSAWRCSSVSTRSGG